MSAYVIEIPNWLPWTTNEYVRTNHFKRQRRLKAETEIVAAYAKMAGVPPAKGRRRVAFTFSAPSGRGAKVGDPDGRLKVLLDCMVRAGLLVDDSDAFVELAPRVAVRGKKGTTITLDDLEDAHA